MVEGGFVDDDQVGFGEDVVEYSARGLGAALDVMRGGSRGAVDGGCMMIVIIVCARVCVY